MTFDPRHNSRVILDGADRAAARSYFRAVGFTDEDLARPLVGVAHCWIELTPCNSNHRKLAEKVKEGVRAAGGRASASSGAPPWTISSGSRAATRRSRGW